MLFDNEALFSDKQAITADVASTNVIDLGAPGTPKHAAGPITQDIGFGRPIPIRIQVTETFNNLTSLTVKIQVDNDENFGSPTDVVQTEILLANLKVGHVVPVSFMPRGVNERYVRLYYDVTGTAPTTGKIMAGLVFGNESWAA